MQLVEAEIDDFENKTAILRGMEVSKNTALKVEEKYAKSVRVIISNLHGETSLRFKTNKTEGGILVWRIE